MDGFPQESEDSLHKIIESIPNDEGIIVDKAEDYSMLISRITSKDLEALAVNPDFASVIVSATRPGGRYFQSYLEYEHFPPDVEGGPNPAKEYQLKLFRWHGQLWNIATVPIAKKQILFDTAESTQMRVVPGTPVIATNGVNRFAVFTMSEEMQEKIAEFKSWYANGTIRLFPMQPKGIGNVFTLENVSKSHVYEGFGITGSTQDVLAEEDFKLYKLRERFLKRYGIEGS